MKAVKAIKLLKTGVMAVQQARKQGHPMTFEKMSRIKERDRQQYEHFNYWHTDTEAHACYILCAWKQKPEIIAGIEQSPPDKIY